MCKLLMIDDNPMEHLIMQKIFDRLELFHNAAHSVDAQIIIEFLKENCKSAQNLPDIIFLDLNMPGCSGWDFLHQFEQIYPSFEKTINIYIVSSSIDPEEKSRSTSYPFVKAFLSKPVQKETLELISASNGKSSRRAS